MLPLTTECEKFIKKSGIVLLLKRLKKRSHVVQWQCNVVLQLMEETVTTGSEQF